MCCMGKVVTEALFDCLTTFGSANGSVPWQQERQRAFSTVGSVNE